MKCIVLMMFYTQMLLFAVSIFLQYFISKRVFVNRVFCILVVLFYEDPEEAVIA